MKKINLFTLLILCGFAASAQSDLFSTPYKWQIKKWGLSFGSDMDMLGSVEHDYLLSTLRGDTDMDYSNLQFDDQTIYSMTCENPHLRLTATLPVPRMKNAELNVSAIFVGNKIDAVSYSGDKGQWLEFTSITNEVGLEAVFLKRGRLIGNFLNLYGGLGTNLGASFGGTVTIDGDNIQTTAENEVVNFSTFDEVPRTDVETHYRISERHQSKTGYYQRVFGQLGVGFLFAQRFELGIEYRRGLGFRAISGAKTQGTQYHSVALNLAWRLR